ncbi:MAG: peptidylprolyl isomerase [Sandaracinaceae bacterium]|nr:peptidylprolyl isomerase [Sandaracinaceae bacterium]
MRSTLLCALLLAACGGEEAPAAPPPSEPPVTTPEPIPPVWDYPGEACVRVLVVAWQGATGAAATVTRSEEDARARAEQLRARVVGGEDLAALARTDSDAAASGPRGGLLGTYTRDTFPPIHEPIRDPVFALEVGTLSDVLRAPYGYVLAQRCPVEKLHTRHVLVRHVGARNAPADVTRTEAEARARAEALRARLLADGADFAAIARAESEDGSAEDGGDLGMVGRGLLAPAYEDAAWRLAIGEISPVVQTEFGFHVIERLADLPPP